MTEKSMTPEEAAKEIAEFYGWRFPHPEILDIIHQQRAQERKLCFAEIETIDELRHKIGEKYDIAYGDSDWISNMVESIIYKQRAQAVAEAKPRLLEEYKASIRRQPSLREKYQHVIDANPDKIVKVGRNKHGFDTIELIDKESF